MIYAMIITGIRGGFRVASYPPIMVKLPGFPVLLQNTGIPGKIVGMKVHLPNSAFLGNIEAFLAGFDSADPHTLKITANKKWISVHPVVLAMIAALGQLVPKDGIRFEPFEAKSKHYFERMKLFELLGVQSGIDVVEHEPSGRFVPLTQIKDQTKLNAFITDMIPLLHLSPVYADPIRYIVHELVRNVLEHASSHHGAFVAAQYYEKSNSIRIGIADVGVGIRRSISRSHTAADDLAAIRLALTPGITGTTAREGGTTENAGAGLFFIKSIAAINGDFFAIYSGRALYKLLRQGEKKRHILHANPLRDRHSEREDLPVWPGTAVGIDMVLDENEKFSALMEHIRATYSKAVRERKKVRYKKPRFV